MTTVFFDIDTQLDFLLPAGALAVPGAASLIQVVTRLNRSAAARAIPIISTMDAHAEDDPEFRSWPAHCVHGTIGQRKPESTLIDGRLTVPTRPGPVARAPQIILEKVNVDCFTNPNLPALLEALGAQRCVVYGVVTEICVRHAVFGLLQTGRRVEIVGDAVRELSILERDAMLAAFRTRGGIVSLAAEIFR